MKKINIAELLKDCPEGMEFDCTMYNNVKLDRVNNEKVTFPIRVLREDGNFITLTKYGQYTDASFAKCVIFPKGKTTWEDFIPPCPFKDGDIVVTGNKYKCVAIFKSAKSFYDHEGFNYYVLIPLYIKETTLRTDDWIDGVGTRLATDDEKEKLFKAIKENGYRWNAETKTLEKLLKFKVGDKITNGKTSLRIGYIDDEYYYDISKNLASRLPIKNQDEWNLIPKKFDITTLKPFDKVLVRDNGGTNWMIDFLEIACTDGFICYKDNWNMCIPYEGNEHLHNTKNDCDDYYKTWE